MTKGVLGLIVCPMVDDNLVYNFQHDPEPKRVVIVDNRNARSIKAKLDQIGQQYELVPWDDIVSRNQTLNDGGFTVLIYMIDLGLHSKPDELKAKVEDLTFEMQPFVDSIGYYLGTCGNYDWNIPEWCESKGLKPSAMFVDKDGCLCHDCVGINIAGGPKYNELQHTYMGHLYVFPAMATNFDDFMDADQAKTAATMASITDEMREELGIEPGKDGYLRWLLGLGGYEYILRIDTGLGNKDDFDRDIQKVAERTRLKIRQSDDYWPDLGPTIAIYEKCKSFLEQ
jgi:hypothetical protein